MFCARRAALLSTSPPTTSALSLLVLTTAPIPSFPAVPPSGGDPDASRPDAVDPFAAAVNAPHASRDSLARPTPPTRLSMPSLSSPSPSRPSASSLSLPPSAQAPAFPSLLPPDLPDILADPDALILDLRPFNAYDAARLRGALSLSVPSTLLKRPTYALARLAPMISSTSARARFATWRDSSRILVYDADGVGLLERPALLGLLLKFRAEGFDNQRQVAWLKGGFNAVWRERSDLIDHSPLPDEGEEEDDIADLTPAPMGLSMSTGVSATVLPAMSKSSSAPATTLCFPPQNMKALRTKALPMSAFTSASTLAAPHAFRAPLVSAEGVSIPTLNDELSKMTTDFARSSIWQTTTPSVPGGSSKVGTSAAHAVPPPPGPSLLAARARASRSMGPMDAKAAPSFKFNLRLPAFSSAPGTTVPPQTATAPEDVHPFPPVVGTSGMPTLSASPGTYSATIGGVRPHRYSVPNGKQVSVCLGIQASYSSLL